LHFWEGFPGIPPGVFSFDDCRPSALSRKRESEFWIWWFWSCRYHEEFERERERERENASKKGVSLLLGEEEEEMNLVVNFSSQIGCKETITELFLWSHKAFPLCQGFQRKGNGFFHRCLKCNRLMADGAKALLLCSSKTVKFVVVIVAALHREGRCLGFIYLLLSVLRRLCFIMVYINFCSPELFFLKRNG
jgi:hypothetical protein